MKKLRIGFDLDRVFVNYPPLVPGTLIEYLYKKRNGKLSYRIPGRIERTIRNISHITALRPPIAANIEVLAKISKKKRFLLYLVSSRFSFLRERTDLWDKKHKISRFFEKIFFNSRDEQPHEFKDEIIRKEKIDKFIDDDLDLLIYLAEKNPDVDFYWLSQKRLAKNLPSNIALIHSLDDFLNKYV